MIPINQHSTTIAKKIVGVFKEDIPVRAGFDGFFMKETTPTLMVSVEVERDNDLIAVDVQRFTEGNRNTFTKHTEKIYVPPFYKEIYDFARDEVYMNTVALGVTNNANVNAAIAQNALRQLRKNRKMIERAIRKQQADVLMYGIVTLKNGDSIDYKRKAASMVDLTAGSYWNEAGSDPISDLQDAMTFLRDEGNSNGDTVNVVMRSEAMNALLNNENEALRKALDSRRMDRANIVMPQFNEATGMAFHGQMAAGDFVVNLWTYNEKYTDKETGLTKYYLDREQVVVLPSDFEGKTVFGGLPYMRDISVGGVSSKVPGVIERDFLVRAYSDEETISSALELTSAPLVVPFTIDKTYTIQVLASA